MIFTRLFVNLGPRKVPTCHRYWFTQQCISRWNWLYQLTSLGKLDRAVRSCCRSVSSCPHYQLDSFVLLLCDNFLFILASLLWIPITLELVDNMQGNVFNVNKLIKARINWVLYLKFCYYIGIQLALCIFSTEKKNSSPSIVGVVASDSHLKIAFIWLIVRLWALSSFIFSTYISGRGDGWLGFGRATGESLSLQSACKYHDWCHPGWRFNLWATLWFRIKGACCLRKQSIPLS